MDVIPTLSHRCKRIHQPFKHKGRYEVTPPICNFSSLENIGFVS